jgi:hypothetical protein
VESGESSGGVRGLSPHTAAGQTTAYVTQTDGYLQVRNEHKVHIYKEYHRVCPLVGIGTLPPPLSPASVPLPLEPKGGGGHTRLRVRGCGSPNSDDWRKAGFWHRQGSGND